jgi:hypothetical protein
MGPQAQPVLATAVKRVQIDNQQVIGVDMVRLQCRQRARAHAPGQQATVIGRKGSDAAIQHFRKLVVRHFSVTSNCIGQQFGSASDQQFPMPSALSAFWQIRDCLVGNRYQCVHGNLFSGS